MALHIRKSDKHHTFKHLYICEPVGPLMVVFFPQGIPASYTEYWKGKMQIELLCTKYINYTQCLCEP